jgi:hypothetical protein
MDAMPPSAGRSQEHYDEDRHLDMERKGGLRVISASHVPSLTSYTQATFPFNFAITFRRKYCEGTYRDDDLKSQR